MKIGFIGLGIMGSRMAANLQKAGFALVVYNRTKAKAEALLAGGAEWAATPAEVGGQVEVLLTMLATPQAVEELALGAGGFLDALPRGALWVDHSTVNPGFSRKMAVEAVQRGIRFVDAPVAGSRVPAEKGELVILAGGDAADVEACRPYFAAMGRQTVHVGAAGQGTALKMVNNVLLGQAMLAFSEALALGQAFGLSRADLLDYLLTSTVAPPFMAGKRSRIENGDYAADFPLQWMQKDLRLASESASEQGLALASLDLAKGLYQLAARSGLEAADFSAIYSWISENGPHHTDQ